MGIPVSFFIRATLGIGYLDNQVLSFALLVLLH